MRCLSLSVVLLGALTLGSLRPGCLARAEDPPPLELLPKDRPIPAVIDHYINQQIAEQGVTPAPLADDATLLRRLTLDLNWPHSHRGRICRIRGLDSQGSRVERMGFA